MENLNALINAKSIKHWAESLESGDRVLATIRHATDGSLNRHRVNIVVVSVSLKNKSIIGFDGREKLSIPFNELTVINDPVNF